MRPLQIDDLTRRDHYYLEVEDTCYYFGEYYPRSGYGVGFNSEIYNFKMAPSVRHNRPDRYIYKERAISKCAGLFRGCINSQLGAHFIPMPPSKVVTDPDYDDRVLRLCHEICQGNPKWIPTDILRQSSSIESFHSTSGKKRMPPDRLANVIQISNPSFQLKTENIILLDDVLTTGSHYKAAKIVLTKHFGNDLNIIGFFIARTARPSAIDDFEDVSDQF